MSKIQFINGNFLRYDIQNDKFYIFKGNMTVQNGVILNFTKSDEYEKCKKINLNNMLVMPSLKNAHIHLGETIFSPLNGKWHLETYLQYTEYYNKLLGKNKDKYWTFSAIETLNECITNGISNICTARGSNIIKKTNIKCNCGYPIMMSDKLKHYIQLGVDGFNNFKNSLSHNITPGIFLHSLYTNNKDSLNLALECSKNSNFITTHIFETQDTENKVKNIWNGLNSIEILDKNKLLTQNTILVHGGYLTDKELTKISEKNASLVICPISNEKLQTKCIDPNILDKYKIKWSLGTDGLATGETCNLFIHTKKLKEMFAISSEDTLKSVTFNASDVLNYNKNKYLDIGYEADFITLSSEGNYSNLNTIEIINNITDNKYTISSLFINGKLQKKLKNKKLNIDFNNKHVYNWK